MDDRELLRQVGLALRRARKRAGLTQERLAFTAEVDRVTIARIEGGQLNPTVRTLGHLARALGIRPRALLP